MANNNPLQAGSTAGLVTAAAAFAAPMIGLPVELLAGVAGLLFTLIDDKSVSTKP